jgi:hypothetical protein
VACKQDAKQHKDACKAGMITHLIAKYLATAIKITPAQCTKHRSTQLLKLGNQ